jgi:hypothetical protein
MKALNLANASTANSRRALDFYPTPPDATHALMLFLGRTFKTIWEPACGDGAMSNVLLHYAECVLSSDLRDTGAGEVINFLDSFKEADAIITNPPFNKSEDFIRHAVSQTKLTAMLLKSQYWHAAKRQALFAEFSPTWILPLTWRPDFMGGERGGSPTMDVIWVVWDKESPFDYARYKPLFKPSKIDDTMRQPSLELA